MTVRLKRYPSAMFARVCMARIGNVLANGASESDQRQAEFVLSNIERRLPIFPAPRDGESGAHVCGVEPALTGEGGGGVGVPGLGSFGELDDAGSKAAISVQSAESGSY